MRSVKHQLVIFCLIFVLPMATASAQATYSVVADFDRIDGATAFGGLILGSDGNYYGTTLQGGIHGTGNFFSLTPSGNLTNLYSFPPVNKSHVNLDGASPIGNLVESNGIFYGVAEFGGAGGNGTVYSITPGGTFTRLHSFSASDGMNIDGAQPRSGLVLGPDGGFFGVAPIGGANDIGTIYRINAAHKFTVIHTFSGTDGAFPAGTLLLAGNGSFYGTANAGGAYASGTVFKISTAGAFTTIFNFSALGDNEENEDGAGPLGGLVQASDHFLYGSTAFGGTNALGTIFRISSSGAFKVLHTIAASSGGNINADGDHIMQPLIQGSDGNFYGTAPGGGTENGGTIFSLTPSGSFTTLFNFPSNEGGDLLNGSSPMAPLLEVSDDTFYGTTEVGGASGDGTVFQLSVPK